MPARSDCGEGRLPHDDLVRDAIARRLGRRGFVLEACLSSDEDRWWSYLQLHTRVLVLRQTANRSIGSSSAVAAATYAGLVARATRADLGRDPRTRCRPAERERTTSVPRSWQAAPDVRAPSRRPVNSLARWQRSQSSERPSHAARDADTALLPMQSTLQSPNHESDGPDCPCAWPTSGCGDALWVAIDQRRIDGRELWQYLARHLPDSHSAPAFFLFGWCTRGATATGRAGGASRRAGTGRRS